MAENSKIEWTDHTFNPWVGCQKVGPGCDHCYAEGWAKRSGLVKWGPGEDRRMTGEATWRQPIKWNAAAEKAGKRARVFCASLADVFDNAVPEGWRLGGLFELIRVTPHLDWLLLTKRPGNIADMLPDNWGQGWPNVWLGCTVVNQAEADRDIPKLLAVPAAVRFLSMEPLLGPVRILDPTDPDWLLLDLVIVGGESGPGARPMHPDWARSLRDQCQDAGVAFFFKQQGEWSWGDFTPRPGSCGPENVGWILPDGTWRRSSDPDTSRFCQASGAAPIVRVGKARAGRLLDGREWNQMPGVTHG